MTTFFFLLSHSLALERIFRLISALMFVYVYKSEIRDNHRQFAQGRV